MKDNIYRIGSHTDPTVAATTDHWLEIGKRIWKDRESVVSELARSTIAQRKGRANGIVLKAKIRALKQLLKQYDNPRNLSN